MLHQKTATTGVADLVRDLEGPHAYVCRDACVKGKTTPDLLLGGEP